MNDLQLLFASQKDRQMSSRKGLSDVPDGHCLHRIIEIIAETFSIPFAVIALHDSKGVWFTTGIGFDDEQLNLVVEFISTAAPYNKSISKTHSNKDEPPIIKPFRAGELDLHFAEVRPLTTGKGDVLGYLAMFDKQERSDVNGEKAHLLDNFVNLIIENLEASLHMTKNKDVINANPIGNVELEKTSQMHGLLFTNAVLDTIENGVITCDAEGKLVYFNQASERFHGLLAKNIPVEKWANYYNLFEADGTTPLERDRIPLLRALNGETVQGFDLVIRPKGLPLRRMRVNAQTLYDGQGVKSGALCSMHDMTEHYDSKEKYHQMYNQTPTLMHSVDKQGKIINVSDFWLVEMGYERDEVIGHPLMEFMAKENRQVALDSYSPQQLKNKYDKTIYHEFVKKNGELIPVLLSAIAELDEQGEIKGTLCALVDATERKRLEQTLSIKDRQFKGAFNAAAHGMALASTKGELIQINEALCELSGYTEKELLYTNFQTLIHPDSINKLRIHSEQLLTAQIDSFQLETRCIHKSGEYFWINISAALLSDIEGEPTNLVLQVMDLTQLKEQEARELRNHKMDAVGQLSGGLAHDFNNLLAVVLGNLELIERSTALNEKSQRRLNAAMKAAQSGADVTRRLLAFSQSQVLQPKLMDINDFLQDLYELLHSTLGEIIDLEIVIAEPLRLVIVDPGQLEAAILNLAINARDAMTRGGELTISAENVVLDEEYLTHHSYVEAGNYVKVSVTDRGIGMSKALIAKMFEPYFSTKGPGKGSGLGLSMTLGFVKQTGGHIEVYSEEGVGTTVNMYLPSTKNLDKDDVFEAQTQKDIDGSAVVGGDEGILVVDDDDAVRQVAVSLLEDLGYEVFQACNGRDALNILQQNPKIMLLFSDIVMPGGMNGLELAQKSRERHPQIKVLHSSGFATAAMRSNNGTSQVKNLLSKPYRRVLLAQKIREVLDADLDSANSNQ
jgi:PAS domain S-box-containing protein